MLRHARRRISPSGRAQLAACPLHQASRCPKPFSVSYSKVDGRHPAGRSCAATIPEASPALLRGLQQVCIVHAHKPCPGLIRLDFKAASTDLQTAAGTPVLNLNPDHQTLNPSPWSASPRQAWAHRGQSAALCSALSAAGGGAGEIRGHAAVRGAGQPGHFGA